MNWRRDLARGRVPILDGGTGSELRRRGIELSDICWSAAASLEHADLLTEIHSDYIRAGADIVTANTFGATRFVLEAAGLAERRRDVARAAIDAAHAAASRSSREITVAASLSCLPPGFDASAYPSRDKENAAYLELASIFVDYGVELVLLEMIQDPAHAELVCRAVDAAGLPYWIGVSCRRVPRNQQSADSCRLVGFDEPSIELTGLLESVLQYSPEAMAIMHTPLDAMIPALDQLRGLWSGPIAAYAELPYAEDPGATRAPPGAARVPAVTPADYAAAARDWLAHGADILGGCCGTTPAHIAALSALVAG